MIFSLRACTATTRRLASLAVLGFWAISGAAYAQQGDTNEASPADVVAAPTVLMQFTTGVENREPLDQVTFVETNIDKIYLFSDLRELTGQTVTHRWSYKGETMAEVAFVVRGPRWRVWSSKDLRSNWVGDWKVEIIAEGGEVLAAETFTYTPGDPE
jgi:hypothetical protein